MMIHHWWNMQNSLTIPPPNQQNIYKQVVQFPTSGHLISQWDRCLAACSALGCQLAPAKVERLGAGSSRRELRTGRGGRESIQFLGRPHSPQPCDPSDRSTPFCASSYERGAHCSLLLESPSTSRLLLALFESRDIVSWGTRDSLALAPLHEGGLLQLPWGLRSCFNSAKWEKSVKNRSHYQPLLGSHQPQVGISYPCLWIPNPTHLLQLWPQLWKSCERLESFRLCHSGYKEGEWSSKTLKAPLFHHYWTKWHEFVFLLS